VKRSALAFLVVAIVTSGCSHVHPVSPVTSQADLDEVNAAVRGRRATVGLAVSGKHPFGGTFLADDVRVTAETTSFALLLEPLDVTALAGEQRYAARRDSVIITGEVGRLTVSSWSRGALDGAVLGLGFGAVLGLYAGSRDSWFTPGEYAAGVGVLGCGIGAVIGGLRGSKEIYEFEHR